MSEEWLTRAERTDFQETSRYPEAIEYCRRLQSASSWIHYTTFGTSLEGRDLPLLIISKHGVFSPEQARQTSSLILLILNGIHAGEIAGKEATFMLLRDIAITQEKASLLDNVILLVVPIFNVDGHERFGPYNRINQNGPKQMGWRTNSQNRNLNRDWLKAEQPETRAVLRVFNAWLPDFLIDNHVSDGADFQYDVTWLADDHVGVAARVREYFRDKFEPQLIESLAQSGHITGRYFELVDQEDPAKGSVIGPFAARYSNGYCTLQNRFALVVETHMLKSFQTRIRAHYDLMEAVLLQLNQDSAQVRDAVLQSDEDTVRLGLHSSKKSDLHIRLRLNLERSKPFLFRGVEYQREWSPVSAAYRIQYGSKPKELIIPHHEELEPEIRIAPPLGYLIPPQWTFVIEALKAHEIQFSRLRESLTSEFETYHFSEVTWDAAPFEGHHRAHFKSTGVIEERTFLPGSAVVWLNQRSNRLILELLEPDAADSLIAWGYFNAIFEEKEAPENYVLEKLAEDMLSKDPELKKEFEAKVAADTKFAADSRARLHFFYERSPYRDQRKNAYPIVRITKPEQIPAQSIQP